MSPFLGKLHINYQTPLDLSVCNWHLTKINKVTIPTKAATVWRTYSQLSLSQTLLIKVPSFNRRMYFGYSSFFFFSIYWYLQETRKFTSDTNNLRQTLTLEMSRVDCILECIFFCCHQTKLTFYQIFALSQSFAYQLSDCRPILSNSNSSLQL